MRARILALVAAVAMIVGAVVVRDRIDHPKAHTASSSEHTRVNGTDGGATTTMSGGGGGGMKQRVDVSGWFCMLWHARLPPSPGRPLTLVSLHCSTRWRAIFTTEPNMPKLNRSTSGL